MIRTPEVPSSRKFPIVQAFPSSTSISKPAFVRQVSVPELQEELSVAVPIPPPVISIAFVTVNVAPDQSQAPSGMTTRSPSAAAAYAVSTFALEQLAALRSVACAAHAASARNQMSFFMAACLPTPQACSSLLQG